MPKIEELEKDLEALDLQLARAYAVWEAAGLVLDSGRKRRDALLEQIGALKSGTPYAPVSFEEHVAKLETILGKPLLEVSADVTPDERLP